MIRYDESTAQSARVEGATEATQKRFDACRGVAVEEPSGSQVGGRKFRRQHSVGPYIVDFYCPACRLAVELDGQGHFDSTRSEYDVKRMLFLEQEGVHVLRFENRLVFESLEEVLATIQVHLKDGSPSGSLPQ